MGPKETKRRGLLARASVNCLESYLTVNFAVVLLVSEPDTPVKVCFTEWSGMTPSDWRFAQAT